MHYTFTCICNFFSKLQCYILFRYQFFVSQYWQSNGLDVSSGKRGINFCFSIFSYSKDTRFNCHLSQISWQGRVRINSLGLGTFFNQDILWHEKSMQSTKKKLLCFLDSLMFIWLSVHSSHYLCFWVFT